MSHRPALTPANVDVPELHGRHGLHALPEPRDPYLHLRLHRATTITFLVSVIVHLLVLFAVQPPRLQTGGETAPDDGPLGAAAPPMQVSMAPARSESAPTVAQIAPPQTELRPSKPRPSRLTTPSKSPVFVPPPPPPSPPQTAATPATDLADFIKAQQARRRAAQGLPPLESESDTAAAQAEREAAERNARAARNLRAGTNGLFQLLSLNSRSAAFVFKGWTTDISSARREYIAVDIGSNPSIELAVVRKMIELIRRHYQGNFNWESQRLDRVVVLSARIEDTEGLEEFLTREFFPSGRHFQPENFTNR